MGLVQGLMLRSTLALLLILCSGGGMMVSCISNLKLTVVNNCPFTIWPGIQPSNGHNVLEQGGFALNTLQHRSFDVPTLWHGRIWGRTGCTFDAGRGSCLTGDCDGKLECGGSGGRNPVTLAQLSLHHSHNDVSSYTLSLVDGFNLPLTITPHGGRGQCTVAGCRTNMLTTCPRELQVRHSDNQVIACKSACEAFRTDMYCCTNQHNSPQTCRPTRYSQLFKHACPNAYTYAHDNPALVHNCAAPHELKLIFCH